MDCLLDSDGDDSGEFGLGQSVLGLSVLLCSEYVGSGLSHTDVDFGRYDLIFLSIREYKIRCVLYMW